MQVPYFSLLQSCTAESWFGKKEAAQGRLVANQQHADKMQSDKVERISLLLPYFTVQSQAGVETRSAICV